MAYAELGLLPGALAGFNYGNGLRFSQTVNARNLPNRRSDQQGTIKRLDYTYRYDENANLLEQIDLVGDPLEYRNDYRQLGYDGLDRMTIANSANQPGQRTPAPWVFGWGPGSYQYDALDNLRRAVIGPLDFSYTLDSQGRANQMFAVGFDGVFRHYAFNARGQVTERDHNHAPQFLTWDSGQRLLSHSGGGVTENYGYDGHSHRVKTTSTGPTGSETRYQVYSRSGQMLYQQSSKGPSTKYYHLAGRLIAEVEDNVARYQHTDLIGSPRYVTDVLGQSITVKERVLAPYGSPMTGDYRNGPGYTGHMEDGATGLTYMQARYYDPTAMRFLSPDPVGVDTSTGSNFNRYNYANNNPYRFTDPDGRKANSETEANTCSRAGGNSCSGSYDRGGGGDEATEIANEVRRDFGRQAAAAKDVADGASAVADVVDDVATDQVKYGIFFGPIINRLRGLFRVAKGTGKLIASANRAINETGLSRAAQKLSSHAQRSGGTFPKPTGGIAEQNAQAERVLRGILESPQATRTNLSRGGFEFRLPNGQGARFDADGSFNTFLDPRL